MAYEACELCGAVFQYGPGAYDGNYIPRYQITVCRECWNASWGDGVPSMSRAL